MRFPDFQSVAPTKESVSIATVREKSTPISPSKVLLRILILSPLCFWALAAWWHVALDVARYFVNLPVWDYYDMFYHYPRYQAADFTVLWEQHNEHRILFPELVFAFDLLVFKGKIVFPTILSFCSYLGIWIVMAWLFIKDTAVSTIPKFAAIGIAAVLFAWKGSALALGSPFLLQWTMNQLFAILALAFLTKLSETHRDKWLYASCACGFVCTYSSANGLAVWPLLIISSMLLHLPWKLLSRLLIASGLSVGLYFVGYKSLSPLNWRALADHPLYTAKFLAIFASMPFAILRAEPDFATRIGTGVLVAITILFLIAWRLRLLRTTKSVALFAYCAYIMSCACMIALGRMNPDDPLFFSAKVIRYLMLPLTLWGAFAILVIWIVSRSLRLWSPLVGTLLAVAMSLILLRMWHKPAFEMWRHSSVTAYTDPQWATVSVKSGVLDVVPDLMLFPNRSYFLQAMDLMRAEKLSIFADPEPFWIGRDLSSVFSTPPRAPAEGGLLSFERLATTVALQGWTNIRSTLYRPLRLVVVDEKGRIVGLGERLAAGVPGRFDRLPMSPQKQWSAFVNLTYHSKTVSVYALSDDEKELIPLNIHFVIEPPK